MYFLKTGSPAHLRWLMVFEPLMVITGIVQPLATLPSISKLYFTHSQHASGQGGRPQDHDAEKAVAIDIWS